MHSLQLRVQYSSFLYTSELVLAQYMERQFIPVRSKCDDLMATRILLKTKRHQLIYHACTLDTNISSTSCVCKQSAHPCDTSTIISSSFAPPPLLKHHTPIDFQERSVHNSGVPRDLQWEDLSNWYPSIQAIEAQTSPKRTNGMQCLQRTLCNELFHPLPDLIISFSARRGVAKLWRDVSTSRIKTGQSMKLDLKAKQ